MAVALEGYTVVGLKSRIDEKFAGGVEALTQAAPNSMVLADDDLWRCSFMVCAEAERFVERLANSGLNGSMGPDPDLVIVNEFNMSVSPYCEWLTVAQWNKGVIAWKIGTTPERLIAREGWSPETGSGLQFAVSTNDPNLEFVRIDGNVSVYRDKRNGRELYVGRTAPDADEEFQVASQTIINHFVDPGGAFLTGKARADVLQALESLEHLSHRFPNSWKIAFFLGKGALATGDLERAYHALCRAYELEQETEAVARELAGVCLELGKADEAVAIGRKAAVLKPDDVQTLGNLACAYLFAARLNEAEATLHAARAIDPNDGVNRSIARMVEEVRSGRRPQPKQLRDLTGGRKAQVERQMPANDSPRASFWDRLRFWKRIE